ncbi:MAG: PIN domain-containing protein [Actinomycetota bacterium]|nr:PIN domain-containing protein [Actinomycetota bacterium]
MKPEDVPAGPVAVDTDAFSFVLWGRDRHVEFAALLAGHPLAMPFPVVAELKVGAIRAGLGVKRLEHLNRSISACVVIPSDARVVDQWAALRSKLMNQLKGEGINDLWIAACCLVHGLPIVTNNRGDFKAIQRAAPALRIIHPDL